MWLQDGTALPKRYWEYRLVNQLLIYGALGV